MVKNKIRGATCRSSSYLIRPKRRDLYGKKTDIHLPGLRLFPLRPTE